ncbi:MAG TPA: MerR family transcriptional regulator [Acidimicrobiia bacterium]|nr:MerR family transcriptional regulator [Acidimicrobiia bacterium]
MTTLKRLNIGDAVAQLQSDFPDVSISKIRFLETEGLIHPPRTKSGYREFGPADIERIRYILRQQREHFLPLRVIKTKLSAWERGTDTAPAPAAGPPAAAYFATSGRSLTALEAAQAAGVPAAIIAELVKHGVLDPSHGGPDTKFDQDDVEIIRAAYRMIGHGLEARHLRAIRLGANREVDLFRQLTGPLLRHATPAGRRQAGEVLADVAQAAREMQEAMVRSDLRGTLNR